MSRSLALTGTPETTLAQHILTQCDAFDADCGSSDIFDTINLNGGSNQNKELPLSILFRLLNHLRNVWYLSLTDVCIVMDGAEAGCDFLHIAEVQIRSGVSFGGVESEAVGEVQLSSAFRLPRSSMFQTDANVRDVRCRKRRCAKR